jgi:hypothetical protein
MWQLRLGQDNGEEVTGSFECGLSHGINYAHDQDEVKKAHPEYYALYGGKRDTETFGAGRPCLSSEGLLRQNVKFVRAVYDLLGAPMVSVMPQDGYGSVCQCELCKGKDTPERGWYGAMSDYVWDYVNRVATEVYKTHPDRKINCFAYGTYLLPPVKIKTLSPNIVVGIAQHRRLFSDPAERRKFDDLRKAWLDKMSGDDKKIIIWDYYLHAKGLPSLPVFFPHAIADDLRSLKGISAGDFIEVYRDNTGIKSLAVDHLNIYVTSRFWWDSSQDINVLLEEYYDLFYGPAAKEMNAFIEYSEANFKEMTRSAEKIDKALELLAKARAKAPDGSAYAKRIAWISDYCEPMKAMREKISQGRKGVPQALAAERKISDFKPDGRLDKPFWKDVPAYELKDIAGGQPKSRTTMQAAWADKAIIFGIRCEDADMKNLNISAKKNEDMNIWNGDAVEIMLETQTHSYYQLTINPAGAMMDMDRKDGFNSLWSSEAEVATFTGDNFWSVEVKIPTGDWIEGGIDPLKKVEGQKPAANAPWYFNVCRQRIRGKEAEHSLFSPPAETKNGFHDLMKYGELIVK